MNDANPATNQNVRFLAGVLTGALLMFVGTKFLGGGAPAADQTVRAEPAPNTFIDQALDPSAKSESRAKSESSDAVTVTTLEPTVQDAAALDPAGLDAFTPE